MFIVSDSETETVQAAQEFAAGLSRGDLVYLRGDLGAGKSVFARSVIRALTEQAEMEVPSPTFTLVQVYEGASAPIYHFDLYRIEDEEEIFELGWEDALLDGICLVEWPERLGAYMRKPTIEVRITNAKGDVNTREIEVERYSD